MNLGRNGKQSGTSAISEVVTGAAPREEEVEDDDLLLDWEVSNRASGSARGCNPPGGKREENDDLISEEGEEKKDDEEDETEASLRRVARKMIARANEASILRFDHRVY